MNLNIYSNNNNRRIKIKIKLIKESLNTKKFNQIKINKVEGFLLKNQSKKERTMKN